jgi:hypothetical protein
MFGGIFIGFAVARDFENGFARRLMIATPRRSAIMCGYGVAALVRSAVTIIFVTIVALVAGINVLGSPGQIVLLFVLAKQLVEERKKGEGLAGEERAPAPELHRLTIGALRAVADGARSRELVLDAYLLRAMGIAGWAPSLVECARCAAPGPHRAFHIGAGGSVCMHCRPAGSTTPPQAVLDLMAALHDGDWPAAESSSTAHRSHASGLVAAHLQWHLERQLRTLPLVERVYSRPAN